MGILRRGDIIEGEARRVDIDAAKYEGYALAV